MYEYPKIPIQETLNQDEPLMRGSERPSGSYDVPSYAPIGNVNPNPVTPGQYPMPGTQLFAVANKWYEAPQLVDIIHREIHQPNLSNQMVYRSGLQAPQRLSRNVRIFAPSVTKPGINSARFIDGSKGDVYGG